MLALSLFSPPGFSSYVFWCFKNTSRKAESCLRRAWDLGERRGGLEAVWGRLLGVLALRTKEASHRLLFADSSLYIRAFARVGEAHRHASLQHTSLEGNRSGCVGPL
ncbi:hypothetical protein NDU88_002021 [Pleurodeles waltl]|uniref:Secreted protein n=1 Tax=Pleurodeles waltl TaxID=8319 RepID=A0AAV7LD17_PLEWA|nr:hypothetical protein NDU88_002021 [Pleurodeles waltl]